MQNIKTSQLGTILKASVITLIISGVILMPSFVAHAENVIDPPTAPDGALKARTLAALIQTVTNAIVTLAGSLAVLALLYGGVMYIIARGDDKRVEEAKNIVTYAIIGLVVIGIAWTIVSGIINLFSGNV